MILQGMGSLRHQVFRMPNGCASRRCVNHHRLRQLSPSGSGVVFFMFVVVRANRRRIIRRLCQLSPCWLSFVPLVAVSIVVLIGSLSSLSHFALSDAKSFRCKSKRGTPIWHTKDLVSERPHALKNHKP